MAAAASAMVASAAELEDAYQRTRDEAERAFGSGVVFLERLVTGARHVEVQVIADGQGTAWAIGVRDCSVQRRNQKVIEESASPLLEPGADRRAQGVRRAARARGRLRRRRHRRVPLPPRRADLRLPRGQHPAPGRAPDHRGDHRHRPGQGCRSTWPAAVGSTASEPGRGRATRSRPASTPRTPTATSRPSPGRIARLELPAGPGVRVDTGVGRGRLDPGRLRLDDRQDHRATAATRDEALARLRRAMARDDGGDRGRRHQQVASSSTCSRSPRCVDGGGDGWADTGWIDRVRARGPAGRAASTPASALVAAGDRGLRGRGARRDRATPGDGSRRPSAGAAPGRPGRRPQAARRDLRGHGGADRPAAAIRVTIAAGGDQRAVDAELERLDDFHARLAVERPDASGSSPRPTGPVQLVEVDGVAHRVTRDEGGVLRSPAPALVVATPVARRRRGRGRRSRCWCWSR